MRKLGYQINIDYLAQRHQMCRYSKRADYPCICDGGIHKREAIQRAMNQQITRMARALPYLKARAERFRWA